MSSPFFQPFPPKKAPEEKKPKTVEQLEYEIQNLKTSLEHEKSTSNYYKDLSNVYSKRYGAASKELEELRANCFDYKEFDKQMRRLIHHLGKDPAKLPKPRITPEDVYLKDLMNIFWELYPGNHGAEVASD